MIMKWRDFDPVLDIIADARPQLVSLALHGLQISAEALAAVCDVCSSSIMNLQLRSCNLEPAALAPLLALPHLHRLDLGGTILVLPHSFLEEGRLLGHWLKEHGPSMGEVVLSGVLQLPDHQSPTSEEVVGLVAACEDRCRSYCTGAKRCEVELTAVNATYRMGWPIPVMSLRVEPHGKNWLRLPRFFARIQPTSTVTLSRVVVDTGTSVA